MNERRLLIIGLGNPLMGDDGAGIEVVNRLRGSALPEDVDVMDGGTPGVDLIDMMSGYRRVVVIDAVAVAEGDAGGILNREVSLIKIVQDDRTDDTCSLHEMELASVLKLMHTLGMEIPEITLVGIPAVNISPGIGLSEECMKNIPYAETLVAALALNRDKEDNCHDSSRGIKKDRVFCRPYR